MKFKIFFILFFSTLNTKAQFDRLYYNDVDLKENKADTLNIKLDSILFVGMGASLERIFLSDLSDKLIKDLSSKNIFASYIYIGKTTQEAKKNYKEIDKSGYKTVLAFFPKDTSIFDIQHRSAWIMIPTPGGMIDIGASRKRTTYQQIFDIQLFRIDKDLIKIWGAYVNIDCEPGKARGANKLGKKILARFISNKYIQ